MKEFTFKVDEVVDVVKRLDTQSMGCSVKLPVSVCATLGTALVVDERIREILSICFSRRDL